MAERLNPNGSPEAVTRWPKTQREHTIGVAVVITNSYRSCKDPNWTPLTGTEEDYHCWIFALTTLMFDVRPYKNLSIREMKSLLTQVRDLKMSNTPERLQHLLFVFCGHGIGNSIITEDGQEMRVEDIRQALESNVSGTENPKIMFFDSCRGSERDRGVRVTARGEREPVIDNRGGHDVPVKRVPTKGNYLVVHSTLPDHIAQEIGQMAPSQNKLGLFSNLMTKYLVEQNETIINIVTKVNKEMVESHCPQLIEASSKASFQVAESTCSLVEEVNLLAEASKLKNPPTIQRILSQPPGPMFLRTMSQPLGQNNPTLTAKQIFHNYFENQYKSAVINRTENQVEGCFVVTIKVCMDCMEYVAESGKCKKKEDAKEDASWKILNKLREHFPTLPQPTTEPVQPLYSGPPPIKRQVTHPPPVEFSRDPFVMPHIRPTTTPLTTPLPLTSDVRPLLVTTRGRQSVTVKKNSKTSQSLLNECIQKLKSAPAVSRVVMEGEPIEIQGGLFACQLSLTIHYPAVHPPCHLVSDAYTGLNKKSAKEVAATDLVEKLKKEGILCLT